MVIIELTRASGKKIFINIQHIIFVEIGEDEDRIFTHIATRYGSIWVRETIEQILKKIEGDIVCR